MASDVSKMLVEAAQGYRKFWEDKPAVAIGLGFVPFVGQALGAIDMAAAQIDPEASRLEKGLTAAGMLPWGKLVTKGKKAVQQLTTGASGMGRLEQAGKAGAAFNHSKLGDLGPGPVGEMLDKLDKVDVEKMMSGGPKKLGDILDDEDLYTAYPELRNMEVRPVPGDKETGSFLHQQGAIEIESPGFDPVGLGMFRPRTQAKIYGDEIKSNLFHEIQHAIQKSEGWPAKWRGSPYDEANPKEYWENAGEIMARVTQQRRNWTKEAREGLSLSDHYKAELMRTRKSFEVTGGGWGHFTEVSENPELAARYAGK